MQPETRFLPAFGRLLIAFIFVMAGFHKIIAPAGTIGYIAAGGLPVPVVAYVVAVVVEFGGGLLLIAGYQTRVVAAVLAVFSVVTAVVFHSNFADQNMMIHFMKNIAMAGGLLQVVAFGAGSFSLDARRPARAMRLPA